MKVASLALQLGGLFGLLACCLQELLSDGCGLSLIKLRLPAVEPALAGCFVLALLWTQKNDGHPVNLFHLPHRSAHARIITLVKIHTHKGA